MIDAFPQERPFYAVLRVLLDAVNSAKILILFDLQYWSVIGIVDTFAKEPLHSL